MDDRRVAEYFVVAGLPPNPIPLAEFSCDGANLKSTHSLPPVTDIGVVNRFLGEVIPDGYACIECTVGGIVANLNHGVLRSQEIFLCYRRGRDKPPLVDIGVLIEGRERLLPDSQVVEFTVGNHIANINPNGMPAYITYRRATEESTCNELVVSDICIIMTNKGEMAPHSYCTIERNLNKGTMVGSDIYMCYRKSVNRTNYLAYKAGILDRYPIEPRPNFPVPDNLALFCLPMGATLEAWPPQAATPDHVFSTFVLTILPSSSGPNNQDGSNEGVEKVYGAAITFYERYPHNRLTVQQKEDLQLNDHFGRRNIIHTNKCICILSMWPFFDTFEKFLKYLHKIAHSANHKVPIERYIWHMLECVPFPSARRPRILVQLDAQEGISLAQLEDSPIPLSGACFRKLVMCLRPEGCLLVLLYALTEQKILLHSLRPDVLTAVAEALTMIIFPFHWQCPYIPLCPLGLSDLLDAPTPFLLGLDSRFFDLYDPPSHVICIDLDTAAVFIPEDKRHLTVKLLPKKAARILRCSLDALCGTIKSVDEQLQEHHMKPNLMLDQNIDIDFKIKRKERELEVEIQETFLRFTATILKGYSQYLLPIVTVKPNADSETPSLFDVEGFIRSRDRSYQKFYEMMTITQMFSKFIEERSFVSDKDVSLVFFDDCIEKVKEEESGSRLLEVEPASSEITFFLLPPEPPLHAPIDGYAYEGFPKLRPELFPVKETSKLLSEVVISQKGSGVGSPGSPLARRSKHEIRSAQKLASKHSQTPMMWAKCLLSTCFSLWFAQLPAFISVHAQKGRVLDLAFYMLQRMERLSLSHQDEVCYRVMMQLCGVYSKPVLAVKTFCEMKNAGITPNAITYGYYNRALLESKWNPSNLLWNKLRNLMLGVRAFRQSGIERSQRRKSSLSLEDDVDKLSSDSTSRISLESGTSLDSHPATQFKTDTLSSDPGYCSISENYEHIVGPHISPTSNIISTLLNTAGLLMTSPLDGSYLDPERPLRERPTDLAEHLSETLEKYDQIHEPSMPMPTTFDPSHTDRGPPEYLRSNIYGKDEKIVKKLLQLVYPSDETAGSSSAEQEEGDSSPSVSPKKKELNSKEEIVLEQPDVGVSKKKETTQDGFVECDDDDSSSDQSSNTGVKSFFSRNTPERLSNLWRKGVLGADEKIRGMWKKTMTTKSTSRDITNKFAEGRDKPNTEVNNARDPTDKPLKKPPPIKESPNSPNAQEKSHQHRNSLAKKKKPTITISTSESEKEVQLLSFEDTPPSSASTDSTFSPVVSSKELIEGSGRHQVLAGDPLGALEEQSAGETEATGSPPYNSPLQSPLEPSPCLNNASSMSSRRFGRSNTLPNASCSSSSISSNAEGDCSKKPSYSSLWTVNPPFSGEEFHSDSKNLQILSNQSDNDLSTDDSLALSWSTSFKLPLSGTSTLGLASSVASQGFRQASKHIESLRTQYIDPAMTELASQSNFNYRKNEIISGSLNSMRSAVTSLSKKYTIFKEAIIPTPSKIIWRMDDTEEDLVDGFWGRRESYEAGLAPSEETNPLRRSSLKANTDEGEIDRSIPSSWSLQGPFCLGVWITSCSRCHNCKGLLYDEEIMAGWRPDDSNLNTRCWHCNKLTVPLLTVTLYYLRHLPKDTPEKVSNQSYKDQSSSSGTPKHGATKKNKKDANRRSSDDEIIAHVLDKGKKLEPLTVPYLSPLVLRKELETMLGHDGDTCLTVPSFPDHHPILYWNMLWYFSRLRLPTHLAGLCLVSLSLLKDKPTHESWKEADWRNVYVRCLWDNTLFHQELGSPLYMQWKENYNPSTLIKALTPHRAKTPKDVLESFLTLLHVNQVDRCVDILIQSMKRRPAELKYNHYPIYRDLLFFALTALPRYEININGFEQEFRREFEKIFPKQSKILNEADGAPPISAVFCRKYFFDLSL